MKRIFTFGLMLTALFALTNCTEELVDPTIPTDEMTQENVTPEEEGIPFQIYASLETETKTVGSEVAGTLKTTWEAGDKINVFHSVAGTSDAYVDDGLFTIADIIFHLDKLAIMPLSSIYNCLYRILHFSGIASSIF